MFIGRQDLSFNFKNKTFDLRSDRDRKFLGWVFNQFLYGEVTGIQCGYWLYRAPHLSAASFLARQASEELSHVKRVISILQALNVPPAKAHWAIRFLATEMMGGSWGEHVTMEMALGEGLVLTVFYALADTISDEKIRRILESAVIDEEKHVEFGEKECLAWLRRYPEDRTLLLSSAVMQVKVMRRFKGNISRQIRQSLGDEHPVMQQWDEFYEHILWGFEKRVKALGLLEGSGYESVQAISGLTLLRFFLWRPYYQWRARRRGRKALLTQTYLQDPWLRDSPSAIREEIQNH